MVESFTTSTNRPSFSSVGPTKYPPGSPTDEWTIEQLLYWSLDQYHDRVVEKTEESMKGLREQCEKECGDVMELNELAVEIERKKGKENGGGGGEMVKGEEEGGSGKDSEGASLPAAVSTEEEPMTSSTTNTNADGKPPPSISPPTVPQIGIRVTSGPHSSSTFTLRPKPGGPPCLVGRSKGKKFTKNGVSLYKDQEVSTTHGKFVVEGGGGDGGSMGGESMVGEGASRGGSAVGGELKYYFIDVGSTNGTTYGESGTQLEPNRRLALANGMELKVGNSTLRIVLG